MARDVENAMTEDGWWRDDWGDLRCVDCKEVPTWCKCHEDDTEDDERDNDGTRGNADTGG